jgi:hypothetical protein
MKLYWAGLSWWVGPVDAVAVIAAGATIELAVIDFAGSELAAAPEISRRAAASSIHEAGDSAGAVGEFPANGSNTSFSRFAVRFATVTAIEAAGARGAVMTAVGSADTAGALDADDIVERDVVALGAVPPEVDVAADVSDGDATTTWLAETVPVFSVLSAAVADDTGELADADDG